MKFTTVTGSAYEVDLFKKKIRQVEGYNSTPEEDKNFSHSWEEYSSISFPREGYPVSVWLITSSTLVNVTIPEITKIFETTEMDHTFFAELAQSLKNDQFNGC